MAAVQEKTLQNYYVTFGVQYSREPHPCGAYIDPNGYAVIRAVSYKHAHEAAFHKYGQAWSFLYDEEDFEADYHPYGCIEALEVTSVEEAPSITMRTLDHNQY